MRFQSTLDLIKGTLSSWSDDNAFRLAAALAYYAVFSLAPLLIVAITIAGWVFGDNAAQNAVIAQIQTLIGKPGAAAVLHLILNATRAHNGAVPVFGILSLIFGATGVFVSLQDGMNTVWQVKPKPQNFIVGFLRQRLHTLTLVAGTAFLLLISLIVSAAISAAGKYFDRDFDNPIWHIVNFLVSFGIVTLLFAMIFKILPDVRIRWRDVWVGAAATALLFALGKLLIGLYIGHSSFSSVYGAAASLVLILVWVYYSSLILFLGAEFTRVYANRYGGRIIPKPNAEPLTPAARAEQGMEPYTSGPEARRPAA